jgi:hypothetical protein
VHFNILFPVYCLILGVSAFAFLVLLRSLVLDQTVYSAGRQLSRIAAGYFLGISILFYLLWLSEILPAVFTNTVPASVTVVGLPTNPVHAIDLSVFLPALCITGVLLLKMHPVANPLAVMLLTFMVLMDLTIAGLTLIMREHDLPGNPAVALAMVLLAAVSAFLLVLFMRTMKPHVTGVAHA